MTPRPVQRALLDNEHTAPSSQSSTPAAVGSEVGTDQEPPQKSSLTQEPSQKSSLTQCSTTSSSPLTPGHVSIPGGQTSATAGRSDGPSRAGRSRSLTPRVVSREEECHVRRKGKERAIAEKVITTGGPHWVDDDSGSDTDDLRVVSAAVLRSVQLILT